ncbi:putative nuclease HARBI1 isoform X2 [Coccinella septempunctata]|uniref:putative nuclease HARBI1 isoform X2 n=1 Tax=Coccinella septempunctata TaxID=41139 RepID=UPI001D0909E2|nr:putative nuclease HARBI1 isoform X2 [Coccinella septempunctata]
MEQGLYGNCYLLGDSGYACKPFLFTPVLNPGTEAERRYNQAHIKTRNCIERCFGVLKRRFPCLYFEESDIVHHDQGQQNTAIRNALIADLFER